MREWDLWFGVWGQGGGLRGAQSSGFGGLLRNKANFGVGCLFWFGCTALFLEFEEVIDGAVVGSRDGGFVAAEIVEGVGIVVEGAGYRFRFIGRGAHAGSTGNDGGGHGGRLAAQERGGLDAPGAQETPEVFGDLGDEDLFVQVGWIVAVGQVSFQRFKGCRVFARDY